MWQDGTAASAEEDSDGREEGFHYLNWETEPTGDVCENVRKPSCGQQSHEMHFLTESLMGDVSRSIHLKFTVDPCFSRVFYRGRSSFTSSAYKVFCYLEDGSQWTVTCPEVYDVHTGTSLVSLLLYRFNSLSVELLSAIRRPSAWISSLLWAQTAIMAEGIICSIAVANSIGG